MDRPTDDVITLRRWCDADAAWYVEQAGDADLQRFTTERADLTVAEVVAAIAASAADPRRDAFLICAADDLRRLGNLAVAFDGRVARVSYWLAADARGRGWAARALRLLLAYVCEQHPMITSAELWTRADNLASRRTAEHAGFVRHPAGDRDRDLKGETWPTVAYRHPLR